MYRLHFTSSDLVKTRFTTGRSLTIETLLAAGLVGRDTAGTHFAAWQKQTKSRLGRRAQVLAALAGTVRPIPDLLTLVERPAEFDEALLRGSNVTSLYLATAIQDLHKAALAPYWNFIHAYLEASCYSRGRAVLRDSIERVFSTLSPGCRWAAPVLELPSEESREVELGGTGLLLVPSLFLFDRPAVFVDGAAPGEPPTVVFPITIEAAPAAALWSLTHPDPHQALAALVGHTRATIMYTLLDACTTKELAHRVGVSAAAASQHTSVLRESGLITTHRRMNTVLHTLTPLGMALLTRPSAADGPALQRSAS